MRNSNIIDTAELMDSLKNNYQYVYEKLMEYKDEERDQQDHAQTMTTLEYRDGNNDPNRFSKRYEQVNNYKLRRNVVLNIRNELAKSINALHPDVQRALYQSTKY